MKLLIKNKTDTTLVILPTSWSIPPFQESTTEISTEWWERYKEEIDLMARKGLIDYDLKGRNSFCNRNLDSNRGQST